MLKTSKSRTNSTRGKSGASYVKRAAAATAAVIGVYFGGFLWQEVSPAAYSVVFLVLASLPLLLKVSFWKKLLLLIPLLVFRVVGKIMVKVFGLKAMGKLFQRYGLLERRYNNVVDGLQQVRINLLARWNALERSTQAHLILTFLPILILLALAVLVVELLRFRVLRMVVEKIMQKGMHDRLEKGVDTLAKKVKQKKASTSENAPDKVVGDAPPHSSETGHTMDSNSPSIEK